MLTSEITAGHAWHGSEQSSQSWCTATAAAGSQACIMSGALSQISDKEAPQIIRHASGRHAGVTGIGLGQFHTGGPRGRHTLVPPSKKRSGIIPARALRSAPPVLRPRPGRGQVTNTQTTIRSTPMATQTASCPADRTGARSDCTPHPAGIP